MGHAGIRADGVHYSQRETCEVHLTGEERWQAKKTEFLAKDVGLPRWQEAIGWSFMIGMRIIRKADVSMHVSVCRVSVLRLLCDWSVLRSRN